jgi:two-component system chemotaxis response regulator CheY
LASQHIDLKGAEKGADMAGMEPSVLVIEDSSSVRRLIEVCLRPLGVKVRSVEDGLLGLEAATSELPHAIVLDIGLPGMDGWEVLSRLRADENTRRIKVLVLTAHAQPEMADRAAAKGADSFMTKPFRPEELRESIQELLALSAAT